MAAQALAGAFLAAPDWQPAAMGRVAKRTVGDRRHWPVLVAEIVVRAYPDRPADAPRELARFIAACDPFRRAWNDPDRPLRVRTWTTVPTTMGRRRWPVPAIDDLAELADWLGVTPAHLGWFADRRSMERSATDPRLVHHHRRWIHKAGGGIRLLEAPKRELKDLQRQVLHHILDRVPPHAAVHGFAPGRSALSAAAPHVGQAVVLRFDLESFFTSVGPGRVHGIFRTAGYPEPVAHTLAALCTTVAPASVLRQAPRLVAGSRIGTTTGAGGVGDADDPIARRRRLLQHLAAPHLAQGAPTSPALANLSAYRLDRRMAGLASRLDATYTRYADDLVLSGGRHLRRIDRVERIVDDIVRDEGFRLHRGKSRAATRGQRQTVLGLVVNEHPNVPRAEYDRLRAVLHDAARSGPDAANRAGHTDFRAHLQGRISRVAETNPARAAKLDRAFAAIDWSA
ncbi:MAG: reverse transcriptase family protein [Acidimicrobiales bacterium]|nr:reverse transcriptase family protein [Acidimicrobiales bacterium]